MTVRLLDSLVKRGLATKEMRRYERIPEDYPHYTITEAGRKEAARS
jgi:DNA-binding MarR family transcriptional regulator